MVGSRSGFASLVLMVVACGGSPAPSTVRQEPATAVTKTPPAELKITEVNPAKGDSEGGSYVMIRGNGFIGDGPRTAKVYFGTRQGSVVRFASDTELIVQAPGGKPSEIVDVLVMFEPGGELTLKQAFTFVEKTTAPAVDDLQP